MAAIEASMLFEVLGVMQCRGWMSTAEVRRAYASSVGTPPQELKIRRCLDELVRQDVVECRRVGWFVSYRFDGWPPPLV